MNWPPDIADELPAPRDDEPASLRQDIADELADHLQCSFTRELHFTPEESSAKHNVLNRFGDPRRVARQLWFDAMQEKLMSQRLNLVFSSLMTVACLGALALMGMMLRESRLATQALLEQSQAANAALLDKLAALAVQKPEPAVAEPAKSMEWNSIKIRLVKSQEDGPPAEGYEVRLHGHLLDTAKEIDIVRSTGADGIADLGLVRPGQHSLEVRSPWNERRQFDQVTVLPGQATDKVIICPAARVPDATVSFSVEWPDGLRERGLWLIGHFEQLPRQFGEQTWSSGGRFLLAITSDESFIILPPFEQSRGDELKFEPDGAQSLSAPWRTAGLYFEQPSQRSGRGAKPVPDSAVEPGPSGGKPASLSPYYIRFKDAPSVGEGRLAAARYRLRSVLAVNPPVPDSANGFRDSRVVAGLLAGFSPNNAVFARFQGLPVEQVPISDWVEKVSDRDFSIHERRTKEQPVFDIKEGESNRVVIAIPPPLADNIRKSHYDSP